jgi:hypothetical protein
MKEGRKEGRKKNTIRKERRKEGRSEGVKRGCVVMGGVGGGGTFWGWGKEGRNDGNRMYGRKERKVRGF